VTGHRVLARPDEVRRAVDETFDDLVGPGAAVDVVSSLAEGADRLVAHAGLDRGGSLVALLPLAVADYLDDFADEVSRQEFNDLLAAADEVEVIAPTDPDDASREAAYERAGLAVVQRCDVLVALWDGAVGRGRGGTAALVADARAAGRRVQVVAVDRGDGT